MNESKHVWNYFRAGGVVQVELLTTADLMNLGQLDQKLWMALEMPVRGLNCDKRTLDLLDTDKDGKIRPPELIDAVQWLAKILKDPGIILREGCSISLDQFQDSTILSGAQRAIAQLGKGSADNIHLDDFALAMEKLSAETFNGDGVIVAESNMDPAVRGLIEEIVEHYGSTSDRSGKLGVNSEILHHFSTELEARATWYRELELDPQLVPYGRDRTPQAYHATEAVRAKIEDYFTRCKWIAFDPRAIDAANGQLADFVAIANHELSPASAELAAFPLARAEAGLALPLDDQLNPAWQKSVQIFVDTAMGSTLGMRPTVLTESEWQVIKKNLEPFAIWLKREPSAKLAYWDNDKIQDIKRHRLREALEDLLRREAAVAPEFLSLDDVQRALLYRRDLGRILRNFVNFSDFYRHKDGIFQSGTLFIDSRATELCIEVVNPVKHTTMAGLSGAYLAYCDLHRVGSPNRTIVALITDGDSDNLMLGRNGVFYDRDGKDWDASISRIVANTISLREAFWLPYKKISRFIEEQVSKRAAAAETASVTGLSNTAQVMANADKAQAPDILAAKKVDVGTVAALGVAFGSITTFLGLMFSKFLDLGVLMPFGIAVLIVLISGPSLVLAWMKLKSRNLGPILDANGWAVNATARINVPFASSMTKVRRVPLNAGLLTPDPYAEKEHPWRLYTVLAFVLLLAAAWAMGRLDRYLPQQLKAHKMESPQAPH